jgi:hypothetical protein
MSVGVPIYQRILYGDPAIPEKEEKQALRPGEEPIESCNSLVKAPRTLPSEMLDSTRQAMSALSIHVSCV